MVLADKPIVVLRLWRWLHRNRMDENKPLPSSSESAVMISDELRSEVQGYMAAAKSANTQKGYQSDWSDFTAWCSDHKRQPMPASPETVSLYITHRARTLRTSSIERRLAAISHAHRIARQAVPTTDIAVKTVWSGIRREKGSAKRRKNPTMTKLVKRMIAALPNNLLGTRDRALILLGYSGAFRRSELCGLDISDLELVDEGFIVNIRKSKTDQMGKGRTIGIPFGEHHDTCPVQAVKRWLEESKIEDGPLFRSVNRHGQVSAKRLSDQTVASVVKRSLTSAGIESREFAGHSLRSGFATMAAAAGSTERKIQDQTGHKSLLVLRRYIQDGQLFQNSAAKKLGL